MSKAADVTDLAHTIERTLLSEQKARARDGTAPLARYEMGVEIGRGGMGRVVEATDLQFSRKVAIKELLASDDDARARERFALEAMITGNLEHPSIAPVYERGEHDGKPFYVMRRVRGRTLAEAIAAATTLTERLKLVSVIVKVAHAVGYAHERGVVHRDIKPDNVIVDRHGETFVIDWGIARVRGIGLQHAVAGRGGGQSPGTSSSTETALGSLMGTPAYMAPEQAKGEVDAIDERTDVFALGALLYHVLTARPPYVGSTPSATIEKAAAGQFDPIDMFARDVPDALRAICERAMEKDPANRYATAAELAAALEGAAANALDAKRSSFMGSFLNVVSVFLCLAVLYAAVIVWNHVPAFVELGAGVFFVVMFFAVGTLSSVIEWVTRGRYALAQLSFALALASMIGGVGAMAGGMHMALKSALSGEHYDTPVFRRAVTGGVYESLGNVTLGTTFSCVQLVLWALARRRVSLAKASPPSKKEAPSPPPVGSEEGENAADVFQIFNPKD